MTHSLSKAFPHSKLIASMDGLRPQKWPQGLEDRDMGSIVLTVVLAHMKTIEL